MKRNSIVLIAALILIFASSNICSTSVCGDCNNDNEIDLLDISFLIEFLYQDGVPPDLPDMADADLNGAINLLDITFMISYLYASGPEPCSVNPWPEEQVYLFEVCYINFAWGYFNYGTFVDDQGRLYNFDHGYAIWDPGNPNYFTQAELDEKFANRTQIVQIDPDSLVDRYNQMLAAAQGPDSTRPLPCFDAGAYIYQGFRYNAQEARYYPVIFYQAGDIGITNLSEEAISLTEWLKILDPRFANPMCP